MSCHFCAQIGVDNDDRGSCVRCSVAVCTPPPAKRFQEVHGEICACGCGKLYCEPHLWSHAHDEEGSRPEVCFPQMSALLGGSAFEESAAALATGRSENRMRPSAVPALNRLLNGIQPGHEALRAAVAAVDPGEYDLDFQSWREAGETRVAFRPSFFGSGTIERVLVLAATVLGTAVDAAGPILDTWPGDVLSSARGRHLRDFAEFALRGAEPPALPVLEAWLPPERLPGGARAVIDVLARVSIPHHAQVSATGLADWILRDHMRWTVGSGYSTAGA